jgi:oxalate decarboxylase/phosphoglucose isomerase-like protein (cupin superfamily)
MSKVQLLTVEDAEIEEVTGQDITGYQRNRHLMSQALTGTGLVVLDHMMFPPGFIHRMHRHPNADMVIIPLTGSLQFLGEQESPVEVASNQILVIPRGNWHEIRNVGTADCQVLHFFSGVGAIGDVGYESFRNHPSAPAC